jgi:hypothetical protein
MPWLLPPPARFASASGAATKVAIKRAAIKPRWCTCIEISYLNSICKCIYEGIYIEFQLEKYVFLCQTRVIAHH